MATVNLYPSSTGINGWTLSTGSDAHTLVRDDHTGFVTTDSNYLSATASPKTAVFQLDDFTEDYSSIDGVQAVTRAGNNGRGQSFALETKLLSALGTAYFTEGSGTQAASASYRTQTYTNRTTTDGFSTAWNNTTVDGLRLSVSLALHSGGTTRLTQAYVIVTYTEPVVHNSIFFGTNF